LRDLLKYFIPFFILVLILTACTNDGLELKDGDKHLTEEMHDVISDYIVQKYASAYYATERQFEVHKVYGTSEANGVLSVYMWSYFAGFNKSTGTEGQSGHSLPAVIKLKKDGEDYKVIKYTEPKDGSMYASSLKKMFPKRYLKLAQQDAGHIKDLEKEMENKVKEWLDYN